MPMELYSSEAFVRDIVNAISESEGNPINIGGNHHQNIDRDYAFRLISEAKKAIEGNFGTVATGAANGAAASRHAAIMAALEPPTVTAKPRKARATQKTPLPRARAKKL